MFHANLIMLRLNQKVLFSSHRLQEFDTEVLFLHNNILMSMGVMIHKGCNIMTNDLYTENYTLSNLIHWTFCPSIRVSHAQQSFGNITQSSFL